MTRYLIVPCVLVLAEACCPPIRPPRWEDCAGNPRSDACGIVLDATVGPVATTGPDPSFTCTGFDDPGPDACFRSTSYLGVVTTRYAREFVPSPTHGVSFLLEAEITGEGIGRGRLCRIGHMDVQENQCPYSRWSCASAGSIVLSEAPTAANQMTIRGHVQATFPNGGTVEGTF